MFYLENNIIIVLQHCFKTIRRQLILNTGETKFDVRLWATLNKQIELKLLLLVFYFFYYYFNVVLRVIKLHTTTRSVAIRSCWARVEFFTVDTNRIDKRLRVPLVDAAKREIERPDDSTRTGIVGLRIFENSLGKLWSYCFPAKFIYTKTVHGFAHIIPYGFSSTRIQNYWQTTHYLFFTSTLKPAVWNWIGRLFRFVCFDTILTPKIVA